MKELWRNHGLNIGFLLSCMHVRFMYIWITLVGGGGGVNIKDEGGDYIMLLGLFKQIKTFTGI